MSGAFAQVLLSSEQARAGTVLGSFYQEILGQGRAQDNPAASVAWGPQHGLQESWWNSTLGAFICDLKMAAVGPGMIA